ncbi:SDR family NAD(P)-dependent oxidoreductase [Streptomyces sp. TRM S81-3]|uniref:SDR family NAD(P)-dependent oxidoreductase n=1 Tax=Streptomyces griseicoloratus TaxID=2752516 RepID=A0A926L5B8_9ACTN|nr:SDR family NAD(P)-dependent oxidoreductase [Streptomyces griseicoloratus]MBD0422818.1 SDR family NAD(P)-dependent oxidoreductase [Streptomyces griseicoloratus]
MPDSAHAGTGERGTPAGAGRRPPPARPRPRARRLCRAGIVTGGAGGIGLGAVSRLYEAGANVVITDVDEDAAEAAASAFAEADRVRTVVTDVSSPEDAASMVRPPVEASR